MDWSISYFAYLIAGIFLFLIMRAMGEMIYLNPTTGSFATFASDYIHPAAGYMTAWSNIFQMDCSRYE